MANPSIEPYASETCCLARAGVTGVTNSGEGCTTVIETWSLNEPLCGPKRLTSGTVKRTMSLTLCQNNLTESLETHTGIILMSSSSSLLKTTRRLWEQTVRDNDPQNVARVYLQSSDGSTSHCVVGGQTRREIQSKVVASLPDDVRLTQVTQFEEGEINHPNL